MFSDLRYALRRLLASPGFALLAVAIMALSIGANTAHFTLTNALLFRAVPGVPDMDGLVRVYESNEKDRYDNLSYPDWIAYRRAVSLAGLAIWRDTSLLVGARGAIESANGALVTANYFEVLGLRPAAGRFFAPGEDRVPGAPAAAVISHALWEKRFGKEPGAIGATILLHNRSYTVIGVAPKGFRGPDIWRSTHVWAPITMFGDFMKDHLGSNLMEDQGYHGLDGIARLKPGIARAQAEAELSTLAAARLAEHGRERKRLAMALLENVTMDPGAREEIARATIMLACVVVSLLLVACANLANLFLARASARRAEIAVRIALGARPSHLLAQLLSESALLALAGAVAALLIAKWVADFALVLVYLSQVETALDARVFCFTLLVAAAAAIATGLAPALEAARTDPIAAMRGQGRSTARRLNDALVVTQIALSLGVLIMCGLFLRSLQNVRKADPGFERGHLLLAPMDVRVVRYSEDRARLYMRQVAERVRAVPGVQAAAVAMSFPYAGWVWTSDVRADREKFTVGKNSVGPGYFATMGIPLIEGREFAEMDTKGSAMVVIVNQSMARKLWPGEDPMGRTLRLECCGSSIPTTVIGIAKDVTTTQPGAQPRPWMYQPLLQHYEPSFWIHARTAVPPNGVREAVKQAIASADRDAGEPEVVTMEQSLREWFAAERFFALCTGLFGGLGLVIAAVGVYSVVSYTVARRMREFGIRVAAGASPANVLRLVLKRALLLAAAGIAVGVALALLVTRLTTEYLHGVRAADPVTYVSIAALLAVVTLAASYVPARRASRVDVATLLRAE